MTRIASRFSEPASLNQRESSGLFEGIVGYQR
jgi:hypothetical protein